jgi:hypothetical protein
MAAVTPLGRLPTVRLTVPAKPLADVTLIVVAAVGLWDLLILRLAGLAVIVKDPPGVTATTTRIE